PRIWRGRASGRRILSSSYASRAGWTVRGPLGAGLPAEAFRLAGNGVICQGTSLLQRDVAVFFGWQGFAFGAQREQGAGDGGAGFRRADDRVHVTTLGGDIRVGEGVLVLADEFLAAGVGVVC